jgi:signal transduction histidine kinase
MLSVRSRLIAGTIVEVLIFALIVLGIVAATGRSDHYDDQVRLSLRRLSQSQAVAKNVGLEMDKADDLLASNGRMYDKVDYNRRVQMSFVVWEQLLRDNIDLSGDSPLGLRQKNSLARVEALRKTYSTIAAQVDEATAASDAGDYAKAVAIASVADNSYTRTFLPGLESVIASEQANASAADAQSRSATSTARYVPLILAPVGLIVIALVSIFLMRDITRSLNALKEGAKHLGGGDLDYVVETGRDDEFAEVAQAFNIMAADLKKASEELRQYAHTVSHDLKGPLSSVTLASGLLTEELEKSPACTQEGMPLVDLARMINDNVGNATDLITELLHLAEAGQFPAEVESVDVADVVKEILNEVRLEIRTSGVRVEAGGDLGTVRANRAQIYQLFANLFTNAIKYGAEKDPVITVSYLGRDESGTHLYSFRDNGPGVEGGIIDSVFEPFRKGERGGTGIGLATVEKIVTVYGGAITVRNDEGAVFDFTLQDWSEASQERGYSI